MVDLVAEAGFQAVTVRKLTKLAGVSTETFYAQFDGKEECFVSTYALLMETTRRRVASTRSHRHGRSEQVRRIVHALIGGVAPDAAGRLALVEVFSGGPAALAQIRTEETSLDAAVRQCLDRREVRLSPGSVSWVTAGALWMARTATLGEAPRSTDKLAQWALAYLDPDAPDFSGQRTVPKRSERRSLDLAGRADGDHGERDLILAASLKLAKLEGYWSLSIGKIRSAAGVSRASFNRHFRAVEDCYLAAIETLCRRRLIPLVMPERRGGGWASELQRGMSRLCRALAADPTTTRLVFSDVLAPGAAGLRCRETLITEFAATWRRSTPSGVRPDAVAAEATVAALWSAIDRLSRTAPDRLPEEAATFSYLLLSPAIGRAGAAAALAGRADPSPRRSARARISA